MLTYYWSPDGRKIAYTETHLLKNGEWPSGIVVINPNGSGTKALTKRGGESGIQRDSFPSWSPDGERLAFWRTRGDPGLWTVNADGSHARLIRGTDFYDGHGLRWTKSGRLLWSSEVIGLGPIVALPALGSQRRAVTDGSEEDLQPRWAPDGRMIAFDRFLGGGRSDEIFVADANGKNMRDLTNDPASDEQPAWSADGTQIVFASNRNRETSLVDLYVMRADGSDVHALVSNPLNDAEPDWSPDGARIAFARFPRDSGDSGEIPGDIYSVATDGTNEQRLTSNPANDEEPRWSPDGRTIAFFSTRDGRPQLYLMNADGAS